MTMKTWAGDTEMWKRQKKIVAGETHTKPREGGGEGGGGREGETDRQRQTDRQTERQRETETERGGRQTDRQTERGK